MQIVGWWFGRQGQGNWAEAGNISFLDVDVDSGQAGCVFPIMVDLSRTKHVNVYQKMIH